MIFIVGTDGTRATFKLCVTLRLPASAVKKLEKLTTI